MAALISTNSSYVPGNTSFGIRGALIMCVREDKTLMYRGVWYGDNPFSFAFPTVMAKIILVTVISRALYWFLRPIKQPRFVCYVLGGIILGPSFLGRNPDVESKYNQPRENELLRTLAIIGGIYSVFLVGVKMDTALIVRSARNAWRIGIFGFLLALTVTTSLTFSLVGHFPGILVRGPFVFYVPLALSYSFFPVVAHALEELDLMNSELGQLAMSCAMLNDLIYWFFLGLSVAFKQEKMSQSVQALFAFITFMIFTFTVIRRRILSIIRNTPFGKPVNEIYIVMVLVGVLVMAFISDFIGATSILGSLLLGLVIPAGPPLGSTIVQKTECFVSEFLMPLFFVHVGYSTDLKSIHNWQMFTKFQIVIVLGYFSKFFGTLLASFSCNIRFKSALMLSLIMNIKGILELIQFHRWKTNHYIDEQTYTQLVLSTLGVTMIVMPLISFLSTTQARFDLSCQHRGLRTLRSMVRNSEFRILCCIHNEESVHGIITLLEASNPSESSSICAYVVQTSELIGLAAPFLVPYDKKRRQLKLTFSASTDHIIHAFENYARNSRGPVLILPFIMVASYKTMHESLCRLAQDKFIPLIILPFHLNHRYSIGSSISAALRQFNANVQAHAPCTVGILVDRGFSCGMSSNHFTYHVAMIFIGGPDDREALAYATRMSDHHLAVTVAVVRIVLQRTKESAFQEGEREMALDESSLEEFKLKNIGSAAAVWKEILVDDVVEVMNAIRSIEGHYDLVLVGRRRSWAVAMGEEEMSDFVENEELGVIGDMLASSDFCGGKVSVLVMQHYREGIRTVRTSSNKSCTDKVGL
ncbi:DNA-directed DNA polymerase [Trema orientale]|uniref:DNA-directed DNA polymerase n=1 Tax=Trema orientale TaxID=63057 RepID=A0A2P5ECK0_TREOI|nr:DNA-directed DNA polymerase [Trema orientale]